MERHWKRLGERKRGGKGEIGKEKTESTDLRFLMTLDQEKETEKTTRDREQGLPYLLRRGVDGDGGRRVHSGRWRRRTEISLLGINYGPDENLRFAEAR
ncbi:hypothetical protein ACLOJK_022090 [Asimina triloba]